MRSRKWLVGLLAVLVWAGFMVGATYAQDVSVEIRVQSGGQAVEGASVTLTQSTPPNHKSLKLTNNIGVATFSVPKPTTNSEIYLIKVEKTGYVTQNSDISVSQHAETAGKTIELTKIVIPTTAVNNHAVQPNTISAKETIISANKTILIFNVKDIQNNKLSGISIHLWSVSNYDTKMFQTTNADGIAYFALPTGSTSGIYFVEFDKTISYSGSTYSGKIWSAGATNDLPRYGIKIIPGEKNSYYFFLKKK